MSDIRFNQWLHQSGTGGVSQVASGAVGVGTTNPLADFYVRGDAQITGILTAGHIAMGSSITFGDDDRAYFGDGTDLHIYHQSSDNTSRIQHTGNATPLFLQSTNDVRIEPVRVFQVRNQSSHENYILATNDGSVDLFFNGSKKIETTNTGAVVTGILTATSFSGGSGSTSSLDAGILDLKTGGNIRLRFASGGEAQFRGDTNPIASFDRGSANSTNVSWKYLGSPRGQVSSTSGEFRLTADGTIPMTFYSNSNERLRIDSSGRLLVGRSTGNSANLLVQSGAQVFAGATNGNSSCLTMDYNTANGAGRIMGHASSGGMLQFFTNASGAGVTEKMEIAANGEVSFGTSNPTTLRYLGTGHPYNNNNNTVHGFSNIGLVGQYSTFNMPMDHSAATTAGNWWMLGRSSGNTNEWGLSTRPGNSNSLRRVWRCVTKSDNSGILDYQTFHSYTGTETLRIDDSSRTLINNRGNAMPGLSANADDLVIGYGTQSGETGMTMYSTSTNNIRFADNSGTDGAIEYSHGNRWLNFSTANAYKMRITSYNGGSNPKVSVGALATSSFLNNSTDGDRSTLKVGNYLHLDSGGNGNFTAGMSYNCWPQGQANFYQGTVTASNLDNRAAAVLMRYGRTEFWNDSSSTGYTAAQQITTMQNNMTVHAAGYVTTPNQPAFKCTIASDNSPNSGVVSENNGFTLATSGNRDAFNTGNHFDEATGRFTAPITGLYFFHFSVMRSSNNGSGSIDVRIKKNTALMHARSYKASYSTNFESINVTTITNMTAGHYVEFHIGANMSVYEDDSYMLGYLIG